MTTETIRIESESQWLAERAKDVTSTQVAALFDCNPYLTEFELWHQKRGSYVEEFKPDNRTRWGNRLERTIAEMFAEETGLRQLHKAGFYMRRMGMRLGASFDYVAYADGLNAVLIECKNVDSWEHKEKWTETEAPEHIETQVQTQLLVSGYSRAYIVALVGGNNLVIHERTPDAEVQAKIIEKVSAFWSSVDAGIEPTPDFVRDAETVLAMSSRSDGTELEADAETAALLQQWLTAKAAADTVKPLQAQLALRIGTASKVRTPQGVLSCATNKAGARPFRYYPNKETSSV